MVEKRGGRVESVWGVAGGGHREKRGEMLRAGCSILKL